MTARNVRNREPFGALLLDYGGVLTTSVVASFDAFCAEERIDVSSFRAAVLGGLGDPASPFARVEVGAISDEDFDREVAALLSERCGRAIEPHGLKARLFAGTQGDRVMAEAVATARAAGVRTVLVSNSWGLGAYPREQLEPLFDALLLSGEIGMRKPDPEIYRAAARAVSVEPERCVFVDDLRANCDGAEAVGMTAVLHREAPETIARLEELFSLPLGQGRPVPPGR